MKANSSANNKYLHKINNLSFKIFTHKQLIKLWKSIQKYIIISDAKQLSKTTKNFTFNLYVHRCLTKFEKLVLKCIII